MLIDGEKYACEACVRGHRVSNCNHYERPLNHINKKGRPVSQCPHCRGLRKARSSHVKCECGNKGHGKKDPLDKQCCCGTGQRCTCAFKKDHLDAVLENGMPSLGRPRSSTDTRRPRVHGNHSDSSMTHFANGHHAPVHRKNHAGAECGIPYKIPRPNSFHGHSFAHRSTDSLLSTTPDFTSDYFPAQEERMVRSEHGSPGMMPVGRGLHQDLPSLDLEYGGINTGVTSSPMPDDFGGSFPPFETNISNVDEQPPLSAVEPVDWSSMGLLDNTFSNEFNPAPPSYASFDQAPTSHPGLTTASSSGDVSEADEFMPMHSPIPGRSPYLNMNDQNGMGAYNMSTDSLSSMTPPPMLATSAMNNLSMEAFMPVPTSAASPGPFDDFSVGTPLEQTSFAQNYNVSEAQKLSNPNLADTRGPSPPEMRPTPTSDPLWASSYPADEPRFLQNMQEPVWTS